MQNISLSLPSLGYKNYTHLVFSAGPLAPTSRIYPLGGERSLPLFSIRHDRTQGATIVSRNSFTLLGYGGARPVHVGTVRWAGQHEHRAWMERGVERKVGAVDEWMLPDSPEPDAKQRSRREGRRARILIDDEEYEWAHGPEKGLFVVRLLAFCVRRGCALTLPGLPAALPVLVWRPSSKSGGFYARTT